MSKKEDKNFGFLGFKFQVKLINQILHPANKKFADKVIEILHSSYFDNEYLRLIIAQIKDYYEKYERIPDWDTIETIIKTQIKDQITIDYIFEMTKEIKELVVDDYTFVQEKTLNFCRQQELKKANKQIEKIIENGDFENYEECSEILRDALAVGIDKDDGITIIENIEDVLKDNYRNPIPTGIDGIDDLTQGGLSRGELGVVLAPFGVGKTSILTKISNSAYVAGYNVLHIFLEDQPSDIQRKHYACFTGIDLNDFSEHKEEIVSKVSEIVMSKTNKLILKKFSSGITINNLKTYVRQIIAKEGKFDIIILDYIDIIKPMKNYDNEWSGQGDVIREFERMLSEYDMVGWTAVQGNRSSVSSDLVTGDQMGGSIVKAQVGHFIISIAKTLAQKESGRATIAVIKSRFGRDGVVFDNCIFDNGKMLIDTGASDTFLGYEKKVETKKEENNKLRIKKAVQSYNKTTEN